MAGAKKTKIQASEVGVGKRTLEGVLLDLAEQVKANDARSANRIASIEERSARAEERSARAEERSARAEERSARAEEMAALALKTIAAVSQDLQAFTKEMRVANLRNDARFGALEKTAGD
jgi:hypothetical protein